MFAACRSLNSAAPRARWRLGPRVRSSEGLSRRQCAHHRRRTSDRSPSNAKTFRKPISSHRFFLATAPPLSSSATARNIAGSSSAAADANGNGNANEPQRRPAQAANPRLRNLHVPRLARRHGLRSARLWLSHSARQKRPRHDRRQNQAADRRFPGRHGYTARHQRLDSASRRRAPAGQRRNCAWPSKSDTQPSWDILANVGNLSSATILFILQEWLDKRPLNPGDIALAAAFGPGFSAEFLLLQWT